MARKNTTIGDIFSVQTSTDTKKYMQYVANDLTMLNSDVIRAFKKQYPIESNPNLSEIVNDEVEFYAHCVTQWGIKLGFWKKIGNIAEVGDLKDVIFRDSSDYGNPQVKISENWWVWSVNKEQRSVGRLEGVNRTAEIGIVFDAESIVERMKTGEYGGFYPSFE
jgi:hypothetical protein